MENVIICFFSLPHAILCNHSCFGKEINIKISNITGKICLPHIQDEILPNKPRNPILTCPLKDYTWKNTPKNGETEWGRVISYPQYSAYISQIILKFENISEHDIKVVYDNISIWFDKFYNLKSIISCQSHHFSICEMTSSTPSLDIYKLNDSLKQIKIRENEISFTADLSNEGLSVEEFSKITELTNNSNPISFEYDKYQLAIQSFDKKDYPMVIVNASIAIEKSLVSKIKKVCREKKVSFTKLSDKYKMLGGIFSLAEVLNIRLPTTNYRNSINTLRNNVIHNGYLPTKQEANNFLKDTKKYLESFSNILNS